MKNRKKNKGFSLLEVSIVILILSILLVGSINLYILIIDKTKQDETMKKMYEIEDAIGEYVLRNMKIPCPSSLEILNDIKDINGVDTSSDYEEKFGIEQDCLLIAGDYRKDNLVYGGVPTKTLGLPDDFARDSWGNKIVYSVDANYTTKKGFIASYGDSIKIKNSPTENTYATKEAIYVLVSSGANANGALLYFSFNTENSGSLDANINDIDDNLNDKENIFNTEYFDNTFIMYIKDSKFDDIILYKEKKDLVFGLDLKDIPCSTKELEIKTDGFWSSSQNSEISCRDNFCFQGVGISMKDSCRNLKGNYASKNPNSDNNGEYKPLKVCETYGVWGDIIYDCTLSCDFDDLYNLVDDRYIENEETATYKRFFKNPGELENSINIEYLERITRGETFSLACDKNSDKSVSGYVLIHCSDTGKWSIEDSTCQEIEEI